MLIQFKLGISPPKGTSQQKGVFVTGGKAHFFKKKTVAAAESLYMAEIAALGINERLEGPIKCELIFTWPFRKAEKAANKREEYIMHDKRPDADNTAKLLLDCMESAGLYKQDSEIAILHIEKRWAEKPGVEVRLIELNEVGQELFNCPRCGFHTIQETGICGDCHEDYRKETSATL